MGFHGVLDWPIFGAIWLLPIVGVAQESCFGRSARALSLAIYLFMGALATVVTAPLINALTPGSVVCVAAGGVGGTDPRFPDLSDDETHARQGGCRS